MNNHNNDLVDQRFFSLASSRIVVMRAIKVSIVVGTILVAINHGDKLLSMTLTSQDWFKCLLTYLVPYCVSTWSAVHALKDQSTHN